MFRLCPPSFEHNYSYSYENGIHYYVSSYFSFGNRTAISIGGSNEWSTYMGDIICGVSEDIEGIEASSIRRYHPCALEAMTEARPPLHNVVANKRCNQM